MRGQLLRRFLIAAAALTVAVSVWLLPRTVSSDTSTPPAPIELRSGPDPVASPDGAGQSQAVDDRQKDADDGDRAHQRQRRTSRESVPDVNSTRPAAGDDDDGGAGDDDDDGAGDDDDDGAGDDDGDDDGGDDGD